jgi:putative ABC transport system permease protein
VIGETLMITLVGGVAGLAAAAWIIGYARGFGMFFSNMTLTLPVVLAAVGLMLVLALLTGGGPALTAMRVNVATAFRRA